MSGAARDHFGATPDHVAGCLIDRVALEEGGKPERGRGLLMALRKAEASCAALQERIIDLQESRAQLEELQACAFHESGDGAPCNDCLTCLRAAKEAAEQQFQHLTTLIERDEIEDLDTRLAAAERERDDYRKALANHLCEHDMADWIACSGHHDSSCDVCEDRGPHHHELDVYAKRAEAAERALALIEKRAKTERIEDALALTALSDPHRILKLTTDRAYLRGELEQAERACQELTEELKRARCNARILAHAWTTDSRPPAGVVADSLAYEVDQR